MVINSLCFFVFFVTVFIAYYIFSNNVKWQNSILLISSLIFYGYTNWRMLILLCVSMLTTWFIGNKLGSNKNRKNQANIYTIVGVIFGVGLLLYFKYLNFFIESFSIMLSTLGLQVNGESFSIIMPLGISFFTFRIISYLVDIRQGNTESASLLEVATYISFFPCILSGPIDRSVTFLPQLRDVRKFNYSLAVEGCQQILWGMFKKMVIADGLSLFIAKDPLTASGSTLVIVSIMYSIQIYTDFSGYSDMAIGVGKLLGIRITHNFNYPYFSRSISEFWNRWHMSLLSWFRYYIYFPLGGSRCSKKKVIRNTFIIFLISGLWHGANWTFVIWGTFHACLFVPFLLQKNRRKYKVDDPYVGIDIFRMSFVFLLVTFAWIIFRCDTIEEAWLIITKICSSSLFTIPKGVMWALPSIIFATLMFMLEWCQKEKEFPLINIANNRMVRWGIYFILIFTIIFFQGKPADFIYFKF